MKAALLFFLIASSMATPANAQIPRPGMLADTLTILAQAYRRTPEIQAVKVNRADMSLELALADGSGMTSYPDNLHSMLTLAESDTERQDILNGFIRNVIAGFASTDAPINPRNIFPVIRSEGYGSGLGDGPPPYSEPFVNGLSIFFAEDLPTSLRYLNADQAQAFAAPAPSVTPLALGIFLRHAIPFEIQGGGPYMLIADGTYEASFLLDTALWQQIDQQLGEVILIIPARDLMIFADGALPDSRDTLARFLAQTVDEAAYPLGGKILVWAADQWQVD